MPDEFDAFGRKKDDAGLGDLGWGTTAETPAQPQVQAGLPHQFRTVTPVSPAELCEPRRHPEIVLIRLAVLAVIVGVIALAVTAGKDATDTVRQTLDGFKTLTTPSGGGTKVDDGGDDVPEQVRSASFFTPKGLRAGLRILRREQPGKLSNFSMRKDRIDVQVIRGGKTHIVELQAGAEVPQEFSTSTAVGGTDTLSYEQLDAGAPARLMRAANARLDASPRQVDYFVAMKFSGVLQWGVYYKNGKIAQGDSRGRFSRRIS